METSQSHEKAVNPTEIEYSSIRITRQLDHKNDNSLKIPQNFLFGLKTLACFTSLLIHLYKSILYKITIFRIWTALPYHQSHQKGLETESQEKSHPTKYI